MNALTSPFASHIAHVLAHKHALGVAYQRERGFFAEFERLTVGWSEDVPSDTLVRKYLEGRPDGGRPHRLTVMRALARFLVLEEPRTFVPPPRFLGIRRRRPPAIRVLSREEASRFDALERRESATTATALLARQHVSRPDLPVGRDRCAPAAHAVDLGKNDFRDDVRFR